jgi:hypothetical protein
MARTIATALSMPLTERRMRWEAMMVKLRAGTIQRWFADFVEALQDTRGDNGAAEPPMTEPPTQGPLRSVNTGTRYHSRHPSNNTMRNRAWRSASCRSDHPAARRPCLGQQTTLAPTRTDDLLPMMTLGCRRQARRTPSGQMSASPDNSPPSVPVGYKIV